MINGIPQSLINFQSKAKDSANSVGTAVIEKVKSINPSCDEFLKSKIKEGGKAPTVLGFAIISGALVLAGKCIKEIKDKLTETKNK